MINLFYDEDAEFFDSEFLEEDDEFHTDVGEVTVLYDGQNGATFYPYVSPEGIISWTNDRGLKNPPSVDIMGQEGVSVTSVRQTTTSMEDGGLNVITVELSNGKNFTFAVRNGNRGKEGERGEKGDDGEKGEKGDDGVSAHHEWIGTTLRITSASGTSSANLKGDKGDKGDTGEPFGVAKVYSSIAEMNQGYATDGVKIGQFVVIDTGNVDDEDNAKLFVKGKSSYSFLTDLSGAQGMRGENGVGISSIYKTASNGIVDTYTISFTNGTKTTYTVTNGADYTLTAQDKSDIANLVIADLPKAEGISV